MTALSKQEGVAAKALAFTILTAARTSEAIGARWQEIDLKQKMWIVPADRIKGGREHRVPLSDPAIQILEEIKQQAPKTGKESSVPPSAVFAGSGKVATLSNMAMLVLLRRMERADITVHGFRSTFRDWAAEQTHFPREVAEAALAHVSGDKVELAYRRGDFFEKRRQMMDAWAAFSISID
jgi:integrase